MATELLNPTKWTSYCIFVEQTSNANHFHCHACTQNIHACNTNKLTLSPHHPTLPMSTELEAVNSPIADPQSNFPLSIRKIISSLFINNDRVTGLNDRIHCFALCRMCTLSFLPIKGPLKGWHMPKIAPHWVVKILFSYLFYRKNLSCQIALNWIYVCR